MRIGELASATGLTRDTIRFYEKRGLLRAARSDNGYRTYPPQTVQMLGYIRTAQRLGFSLAEIANELPALWSSERPDAAVAKLLGEKINAIDERILELRNLRRELASRVKQLCPLAGGHAKAGH